MKKINLIVILLFSLVYTYGQNADATPSPRNQPALAFDTARNRIVLFGGIDQAGKSLNDTWEWNGIKWERKTAQLSPGSRAAHAAAYDAKRRRVVLFGGQTGANSLADTWEWNGENWRQIQTRNAPSARVAHALVYDRKRGKVVLFGGTDFATKRTYDDTWEFDGKNWTQIKTDAAPEGRFHHAMAFDSKRQRIVLFGGNAAVPPLNSEKFKAGQRNDVWEFGSGQWRQINSIVSPPKRDHSAVAYDEATRKTILFGGFSGGFQDGVYLGDTWAWDGRKWRQLEAETSPPARAGKPGMIYDAKSKRVILFGGGTPQKAMNDLWFFTNGQWSESK